MIHEIEVPKLPAKLKKVPVGTLDPLTFFTRFHGGLLLYVAKFRSFTLAVDTLNRLTVRVPADEVVIPAEVEKIIGRLTTED